MIMHCIRIEQDKYNNTYRIIESFEEYHEAFCVYIYFTIKLQIKKYFLFIPYWVTITDYYCDSDGYDYANLRCNEILDLIIND